MAAKAGRNEIVHPACGLSHLKCRLMMLRFWRRRKMPALAAGVSAPDFNTRTLDDKQLSLKEALASGPVVLAFFKVSCPTCQYALPFYERLFKAYKNQHVTLVGVSQNDVKDTKAFVREFGLSLPILLDDTTRYPISNAYRLTNVPTIFWIDPEGEIELTSVGWSKPDFEKVNQKMAEAASIAAVPLYQRGEDVLDYRAG